MFISFRMMNGISEQFVCTYCMWDLLRKISDPYTGYGNVKSQTFSMVWVWIQCVKEMKLGGEGGGGDMNRMTMEKTLN